MSMLIKCDGHDNCQNFDGCCDKTVYPLSEDAQAFANEEYCESIEHLCEDCLLSHNEEYDNFALSSGSTFHKKIILKTSEK